MENGLYRCIYHIYQRCSSSLGGRFIVVGSTSAFLSFPVPGVPPREEEGAAAFLHQTAAGRGNRALFIGRISLPQL